MTRTEFETALTADGYTEIETKRLPPRPVNGEHGHHYAVRGLVLDGVFTVIQNNQPVSYHAYPHSSGAIVCDVRAPMEVGHDAREPERFVA